MKKFRPCLILLLVCSCLFFGSCDGEDGKISTSGEKIKAGSPEYYFEEAKEATGAREKMSFLNKAYFSIEDEQNELLLKLLDFKTYYHGKLQEYDSVLYYSDRYIEYAVIQEDSSGLANAYYRKSSGYEDINEHLGRYKNALESKRIYEALGDSSAVGRRALEMAIARSSLGDYPGTQDLATESLKYLDKKRDSTYFLSAHNNIANTYDEQRLYSDALEEYKNAWSYASSQSLKNELKNNIANTHASLGNYTTAIGIWESLLRDSIVAAPEKEARVIDNLAYTRWLSNPDLDVSADLDKALQMRLEHQDLYGLQASYIHLAEYYAAKNPSLAKAYAEEMLEVGRQYNNAETEAEALEKLIGLGSPSEAKAYAKEYTRLRDSLRIAGLRVQNTFAKIHYDEEQKQEQIQQLQTENALQELAIAEERQRKIIYFSGTVLLLLGGSFYLYYARQRHKKEKLQEVYRTEARISKKVHDELANDVYTVMTQLEAKTSPHLLDKLENIYIRTRNISRENSSIKTGEGFEEELFGMLNAYTPSSTKLFIRGEEDINWLKLSEEKQVVIYRVLQELMTNMKKHSRAGLVALSFSQTPKKLEIQYTDNGKGIDKKALEMGNGLKNAENRIFSINGNFTFEPTNQQGFKAEVIIPV